MNAAEFDAGCEALYDSGDRSVLTQVIAICGHDGLMLPSWGGEGIW